MKKKAKKIRTIVRKSRDLPAHKKARAKKLRELERKIVEQKEGDSGKELDELEHEISEEPAESSEGLGIEEDEKAGEAPYPEIEKVEKVDEDEEEEE